MQLMSSYFAKLAVAEGIFARLVHCNPSSEGSPDTSDDGYDPDRHLYVYVIDITKCIGCGMCVKADRIENNVPEDHYRTWVERYRMSEMGTIETDSPEGGEKGFGLPMSDLKVTKAFFVPKLCNHCRQTPCVQVCPVGASYHTQDGVVMVDNDVCIGCGYCVQACPYGSRFINPETRCADKCTLCYHRITRGLKPACVHACPVGARQLGDLKREGDPVRDIIARERVMLLQPELLTKPACYYLGLDQGVR